MTEEGFVFKGELLKRLEQEGLASTSVSLWKKEKAGIIPRPARVERLYPTTWPVRIYTQQEVENIVQILKNQK